MQRREVVQSPPNPTAARKDQLVAELTAKLSAELRKKTNNVQDDVDLLCTQQKLLQEGEASLTQALQTIRNEKVRTLAVSVSLRPCVTGAGRRRG